MTRTRRRDSTIVELTSAALLSLGVRDRDVVAAATAESIEIGRNP